MLIFGILYAVLVALGALTGQVPADVRTLLAISDIVVVLAVLSPFMLREHKEGWLSPMILFSAWTMVNLMAKRTGLMLVGLASHTVISASESDLTRLVAHDNFLDALSIMCLLAGYRIAHGIPAPKFGPSAGRYTFWVALALLGIGVGSLFLYIGMSGSLMMHIKNLALNRQSKDFESDAIGWIGVLVSLSGLAYIGILFWLAHRPKIVRKPLFYLLFLSALAVLALATGKRSAIILPCIMTLLVWISVTGKVPYVKVFVGLVLAVFAIGFLGSFRTALQTSDVQSAVSHSSELTVGDSFKASLEEMSFRAGGYSSRLAILHSVPHDVPLQFGYTYLAAMGRLIPRAIWPSKPTGTDSYVARTFFGANWGIPAGGVGEAYWNFHIPGVIFVYALFGMFKAWWRNMAFNSPGNPGIMICYLITMFQFSAPADTAYTGWLFIIIPAALCLIAVGGFTFSKRAKAGLHH